MGWPNDLEARAASVQMLRDWSAGPPFPNECAPVRALAADGPVDYQFAGLRLAGTASPAETHSRSRAGQRLGAISLCCSSAA